MKVAVLVNKANFERYTALGAIPEDWELIHIGNGAPTRTKLSQRTRTPSSPTRCAQFPQG